MKKANEPLSFWDWNSSRSERGVGVRAANVKNADICS